MFYIDTSVIVAYYCPETLSETVEQLIVKIKQPAISHLTEIELTSAISRKIREKNLSQADGNRILTQFQSHIEQKFFRRLSIEYKHFQMGKTWISQFNTPLRSLDALHLAVASSYNLTFLSTDLQLLESAKLIGVDISTIP